MSYTSLRAERGSQDEQLFLCTKMQVHRPFSRCGVSYLLYTKYLYHQNCHVSLKALLKLLVIHFNTKVVSTYQRLSGKFKNARSLKDDSQLQQHGQSILLR